MKIWASKFHALGFTDLLIKEELKAWLFLLLGTGMANFVGKSQACFRNTQFITLSKSIVTKYKIIEYFLYTLKAHKSSHQLMNFGSSVGASNAIFR